MCVQRCCSAHPACGFIFPIVRGLPTGLAILIPPLISTRPFYLWLSGPARPSLLSIAQTSCCDAAAAVLLLRCCCGAAGLPEGSLLFSHQGVSKTSRRSNPAGDDGHFITALIYTAHSPESALTHGERLIAAALRDPVRGTLLIARQNHSKQTSAAPPSPSVGQLGPQRPHRLHLFLEFTHCVSFRPAVGKLWPGGHMWPVMLFNLSSPT